MEYLPNCDIFTQLDRGVKYPRDHEVFSSQAFSILFSVDLIIFRPSLKIKKNNLDSNNVLGV